MGFNSALEVLMVFCFCTYSLSCIIMSDDGPRRRRNYSPFNKHIHNSVLVVMKEFF